MVTMDVFPFQGKTHMVELGIEPGTSWLVVRNSDHQATRLVKEDMCYVIKIELENKRGRCKFLSSSKKVFAFCYIHT